MNKNNPAFWSSLTAVVTGAGRGIGAAIAMDLARKGARVALTSRTIDELLAREKEIQAEVSGARTLCLKMDVSSEQSIRNGLTEISKKWEFPNLVVHNAGAIVTKPVEKLSNEDWQKMLDVNLTSAFFIAREVFLHAKKETSYLTVSSVAGVMGAQKFNGFSAYTAAKQGLVGFTENLAVEGAPRRIYANVICPGATDTKMLREVFPNYQTDLKPGDISKRAIQVIERSFTENLTGHIEVCDD